MCGINGFNWNDRKLVKKMNVSIKHRGPDDDGIFIDKKISLGQTRLAIIDLSEKGKQPMKYNHRNKELVISFNGEIYNFQELRKDLINKGYKFNSNTDTEVILASYSEYGKDCVKKFNGMWAFCIYDIKKQELFLSRDRAGKKPIYYFYNNEQFIFSSELKSILNHKLNLKINKEAIDIYLSLGFIPSPFSIYEDIFKLEPRQNLIYNLKTKKITKEYYYDILDYSPINNKQKLISEAENLLEDAVRLRMIADVPVGAFLSGGLDSSAIVAKMAKFTSLSNLHTFSIGFREKNDETDYSNMIKNLFKTKHHHKYFHESDFDEVLKNIFYYFDEPFFDFSMFPSITLSNMARKFITVSLSGDGGDEIFGGYERYEKTKLIESLMGWPAPLRKFLFLMAPSFSFFRSIKEALRISLNKKENFYSDSMPEIYKPKVYRDLMRGKLKFFLRKTKGNLTEAVIMMDLYFKTIPDHFLTKTDRASMSTALEVRCPFLDYRFFELSSKIPTNQKTSFFQTKILMRKMLENVLPSKILKRKKVGFMPPVLDWVGKKENNFNAVKSLHKKGLIDDKWLEFFRKISKKKDKTSQLYKTRIFLLYKWLDFWENKGYILS